MTHQDIYTKYMIEYDKANVTSSYPSMTEYEVATILDKSYSALIAQKVTGNNPRRSPLEEDLKSITDITPLIKEDTIDFTPSAKSNVGSCKIPTDMLYFVGGKLTRVMGTHTPGEYQLTWNDKNAPKIFVNGKRYTIEQIEKAITKYDSSLDLSKLMPDEDDFHAIGETYHFYIKGVQFIIKCVKLLNTVLPMDKFWNRQIPMKLVSHEIADKFIATAYNVPWIKIPVCYIEEDKLYIVYDPIKKPEQDKVILTYIKTPVKFTESLFDPEVLFECNDTVAEELISLAVAFTLENVESQRLATKLNMRGLEA